MRVLTASIIGLVLTVILGDQIDSIKSIIPVVLILGMAVTVVIDLLIANEAVQLDISRDEFMATIGVINSIYVDTTCSFLAAFISVIIQAVVDNYNVDFLADSVQLAALALFVINVIRLGDISMLVIRSYTIDD